MYEQFSNDNRNELFAMVERLKVSLTFGGEYRGCHCDRCLIVLNHGQTVVRRLNKSYLGSFIIHNNLDVLRPEGLKTARVGASDPLGR